jgi:hypothetical protein
VALITIPKIVFEMKSTEKEKPLGRKHSSGMSGIGKGKGILNTDNPLAENKERTQQTNNLGKYGEGEYNGVKTIGGDRLNELKI